jgi:hypothetical protein
MIRRLSLPFLGRLISLSLLAAAPLAGCSNSSNGSGNADAGASTPDMTAAGCTLLKQQPPCSADKIAPLGGSRQLVMSSLGIGGAKDGFDLNCDGKVDNKLALLSVAANDTLAMSFADKFDLVIPIELFGYDAKDAACTKFALYVGRFVEDRDGDGSDTRWTPGSSDCNDNDKNVHPGMTEIIGNRIDDDCDGYADNPKPNAAPADNSDQDKDGVSLKDGDCNDNPMDPNAKNIHRGAKDVCGNGLDEDCDGIADNDASCHPFTDNKMPFHVQALSFTDAANVPAGGVGPAMAAGFTPLIAFPDGTTMNNTISAGPDLFTLNLNVQGFGLDLSLVGTHVAMTVKEMPNGTYVTDGTLGGVLSTVALAQIHLDIKAIGLSKDQSLADGVYVGNVMAVLALDTDKMGHAEPDIDVDGDGLESFWEEVPAGAMPKHAINACKDGDGTVVKNGDNGVAYCPLAKDSKGNYRFMDGLSLALKFKAVPATLKDVTPK